MNKYPEVEFHFDITLSGRGKDGNDAWTDANVNFGLEPGEWESSKTTIESFTCPCENECVAVQSFDKCDLEDEFARDYVCKICGRRWTVDFEGEVSEHNLWVVLTETLGGWENVWFTDEGSAEAQQLPATYRTAYQAYAALDFHIQSCWEAFVRGDMIDFPSVREFKVVPLRKYLKLDELEKEDD